MVQPKYSPEEALKRIKLMMEYDTSKTYTENTRLLSEQNSATDVLKGAGSVAATYGGSQLGGVAATALLPGVAAAGPVGLAVGAILVILGLNAWMSGDATEEEKIKQFCKACDKPEPAAQQITKDAAMSSVEHAQIAKQLAKSFNYQVGSVFGGTDLQILNEVLSILEQQATVGDICAIRAAYGGAKFEARVIDELNDEEQADFAGMLGIVLAKSAKSSKVKVRSNEANNVQWWYDKFPCLMNTDSFVDPVNPRTDRYGNIYVDVQFKLKGQLKVLHLDQRGYLWIPGTGQNPQHKATKKLVQCRGEFTPDILAVESVKKNKTINEQAEFNFDIVAADTPDLGGGNTEGGNNTTPPPPKPVIQQYRLCNGPDYQLYCKSESIRKVQQCLGGIKVDGYFGPETQGKLKEKYPQFKFGFSESDIPQICKTTPPKPNTATDDEEVSDVNSSNY